MNKNKLKAALMIAMCLPVISYADTINATFSGLFTMTDVSGTVQQNSDASGNADFGFRTNTSGTLSFDTVSGTGSVNINAFSFLGSGLLSTDVITFQAIGDGMGGAGTLVASIMSFNWGGNQDVPTSNILDAAGLFSNLNVGTISSNCAGCVVSATEDWTFPSPFGPPLSASVGSAPLAMTTYNTSGNVLDTSFHLTLDDIAGSPNLTAPFLGFHMNYDYTEITITSITASPVPIPAAFWLFGSGLLALASVARHRRR